MGVERTHSAAKATARAFIREWRSSLKGGRPIVIPRYRGVELFRAAVTGLSQDAARETCLAYRKHGAYCVIMDTQVAKAQLEDARRIKRLNETAAKAGAMASN